MQERDYRENQHPPYCTCVDCSRGLNKSKKFVEQKNISKIFKKHKKKSKKKPKKEKLPAELESSVFDSIAYAYKYPDLRPPGNTQKNTVSRKKTVKKKKVKADRSYELNVKIKRADDLFKKNENNKKPKQEKNNNKKPKYNPNKKSKIPKFKNNNPNDIKTKEKSLLRKIIGLGIF